jgi:glucose-1-phosphate cytidylyltransferase
MGLVTDRAPKPMLTVGGRPLLWHVMHVIARSGSGEFVVALGHLGHVIKDFFLRFQAYAGDFRITLGTGPPEWLAPMPEAGWRVTCVDTGIAAGTGTRLREAAQHVSTWPIVVAYGDVLADVDVEELVRYHRNHGRLATVTAVRPPSRFGVLSMTETHQVDRFDEKLPIGPDRVSAGFFVLERGAVERYIPADRDVMFEQEPIRGLVEDGELMAYAHDGFWQPVDTAKDLAAVRAQWDSDEAPWKMWKAS